MQTNGLPKNLSRMSNMHIGMLSGRITITIIIITILPLLLLLIIHILPVF